MRTVYSTTVTSLSSSPGEADKQVAITYGYAAVGDGGGGEFVWGAGSTATAVRGMIIAATGGRWKRVYSGPMDVRWFGPAADGTTDDTSVLQIAINHAAGSTLLISDGTYRAAGLLLNGSGYDGTSILCVGGELKHAGTTPRMLNAIGADRLVLDLVIDGNRANMPASEHYHAVVLNGCERVEIPSLVVREIRGDGLYLSQLDDFSNTAPCSNIHVGKMSVINTADDGRNAVSVISCVGLVVDSLLSIKVGGVISAVQMPGGIDIEPDYGYQTCKNIVVGSAYIETAGNIGCGIVGKAVTNDAARDWCVSGVSFGDVTVRLTASAGATTFYRCKNVTGNINVIRTSGSTGRAYELGLADDVKMNVKAAGCFNSVIVGYQSAAEVRDSTIHLAVDDYNGVGLLTGKLTRVQFTGRIAGGNGSNPIGVYWSVPSPATQTDVVYELDVPYVSGMYGGYFNEPATPVSFTNCVIRDCDVSGYARLYGASSSFGTAGVALPTLRNIRGRDGAKVALVAPYWSASGGGFALGNGTQEAYYEINGTQCTVWGALTLGTTTVLGTSGYMKFALPFVSDAGGVELISGGTCVVLRAATGTYSIGSAVAKGGWTNLNFSMHGVGLLTTISPLAVPAVGDTISFVFTYTL